MGLSRFLVSLQTWRREIAGRTERPDSARFRLVVLVLSEAGTPSAALRRSNETNFPETGQDHVYFVKSGGGAGELWARVRESGQARHFAGSEIVGVNRGG